MDIWHAEMISRDEMVAQERRRSAASNMRFAYLARF
ncbi:unnamed protein product [Gongylonema pulchrum]|uniref:HMG box domain-containing protein n=1 Tax=Gongylonema pulchrum TaxID=637853 RepID=A0A183D7Z4_9BILA|nr:unnamed protein product [Gongylonema pulchrum]